MQKNYVVGLLAILFVAVSAFVIWFSLDASRQAQEIRGQAYGGGGTATPAPTCSEAPVNVQYRKWTGADTPWVAGNQVNVKVGEYIEVNCFSKNGAQLLTNGNLTGTVTAGGQTQPVALPNPDPDGGAQIRKLQITKAGKYTFTCRNSANTCSDSDQFTVAASTSCKKTGCSGTICIDSNSPDITTTCEFKPEYACYQQAECAVQSDGNCGFTQTPQLTQCLNGSRVSPTPAASVAPTPTASPALCTNGRYAVSDLNKDCRTDILDFNVFVSDYRQQTGL